MNEIPAHTLVLTDPRLESTHDPYGNIGNATTRYVFAAGADTEAATVIGLARAISWIIENPPTEEDWHRSGVERRLLRERLLPCPTCSTREYRRGQNKEMPHGS